MSLGVTRGPHGRTKIAEVLGTRVLSRSPGFTPGVIVNSVVVLRVHRTREHQGLFVKVTTATPTPRGQRLLLNPDLVQAGCAQRTGNCRHGPWVQGTNKLDTTEVSRDALGPEGPVVRGSDNVRCRRNGGQDRAAGVGSDHAGAAFGVTHSGCGSCGYQPNGPVAYPSVVAGFFGGNPGRGCRCTSHPCTWSRTRNGPEIS